MSVIELSPEMLGIQRRTTLPVQEPLPGLPAVLPFQIELLPDSLQPYAYDVTTRMQCPLDFVGAGLMAALSAVVGRRRCIYAKRWDNWRVVPNLWCCIIGRPSTMKSPAIGAVMEALKRIDLRLANDFNESLKVAKIEASLAELSSKDVNSKAQKAINSGDHNAARTLIANSYQDNFIAPKQVRLIESDVTVEALQISMEASPNGIFLVKDELSGLFKKLEQYDQAEARAFYLTSSTGRESFTQRRVGRGIINIESCVLSILGGIQPSHISKVTKSAMSGASDDGLIQRFQLAVWPDDSRQFKYIDQAPNAAAEKQYFELFDALHGLEFQEEPLRMTDEALELFADWHTKLNEEIFADEMHPVLQSHLLKSSEAVLSIALLCELADNPLASQVGLQSIIRALNWAEYLRSHAQRLYNHGNDAAVVAAKLILSKRKQIREGFTAREIIRRCWSGIHAEIVQPALEVLINYGYLQEMLSENGGRPTVIYTWVT